jgi:probable rRNA maturation factor
VLRFRKQGRIGDVKRAPASRAKRSSSSQPTTGVAGSVSVSVERGPHRGLLRSEIVRRIHAMVDDLQLHNREISFLLTDDKRIHQLNKVYRDKDRPTDVLAFAMHEGELAELAGPVLGDVIVSVPTARKQADERKVSLLDEVTMLLAHGLLHLLGWDHETLSKDRRMRAETDRLCGVAALVQERSRRSKVGAEQGLSKNKSAVRRPARAGKERARRPLGGRSARKA